MDILLTVIIIFLFIIFNIFVVNKLININYKQYLPNNKVGKFLNFFINRYISIWGKTSKYLYIFSWVMIFIFTLVLKFAMYNILNI
jgi:hypothetical protein